MELRTKARFTDEVTPLELANKELSYQVAVEAIVLLENNGILPILPGKIALYGAGAGRTIKGGTGSGEVIERHAVSFREGLINRGFEIMTDRWLNRYDALWAQERQAFVEGMRKQLKKFDTKTLAALMAAEFRYPYSPGCSQRTEAGIAQSNQNGLREYGIMIQLANIFQDGMTLQQQKPIRLWGSTDCRQRVHVVINGVTVLSDTEISGPFSLMLPPQEATENVTLTISGTADTVVLKLVDIGEVWIAGGQSNMEFLLRYDAEADTEIPNADDPHLRFYDVGEYSFPEEEASSRKDNTCWDRWMPFKPPYAEYFSAVGIYFAKKIRAAYGVPVAIVGCNWGGTTAASWTEESFLAADPNLKFYLDDYVAATENLDLEAYNRRYDEVLAFQERPEMTAVMRKVMQGGVTLWDYIKALPLLLKMATGSVPMGPRNPNRPGCLYHMMVAQISGFTARGVIWYQGESDDGKAEIYDKLFSTMISCWRAAWQDELPFLFVQLAPFGKWMGISGEKYPLIRQKQETVSRTVPDTYMASIMDAGMKDDIHPKQKRPVGERLALLARGKIYGENILCEAPEFLSAEVQDGSVRFSFAHVGAGLEIRGNWLNALELIADGKQLKHYKAAARGNALIIQSKRIKSGTKVDAFFAWSGYCQVNLYNSAGLPAKPFRTT